MDGELDGDAADAALARIRESEELRQDWLAYHLIGDCLRSAHPLSHNFIDRFAERLAQEPTVVASAYQVTIMGEVSGDSIGHAASGKIK